MPTPAFVYQDPLPLGADDTAYRFLTKEGISTSTFEGRDILTAGTSRGRFQMHDWR